MVKALRPLLLDQSPEDWDLGEGPAYRRKQVWDWTARGVQSYAEMTNVPAGLRTLLGFAEFSL